MPVEYFFPTPVYFDFINENDLVICQQEIFSYISTLKNTNLFNPWGDTVDTSFKYGNYDKILESTPYFSKVINKHCKEFLKYLNLTTDFEIKESWVNISKPMNFQHFHIHDTYDISGVYYYQTNCNDGEIVFNNPSLVNRFHKLTSKLDSSISYKPEIGKLIIFPSFLEHAVYHNTSKSERISISFNGVLK